MHFLNIENVIKNYVERSLSKIDSYYSLKKAKKKKKDLVLFATNLTKNIPDPTKAKEYFE